MHSPHQPLYCCLWCCWLSIQASTPARRAQLRCHAPVCIFMHSYMLFIDCCTIVCHAVSTHWLFELCLFIQVATACLLDLSYLMWKPHARYVFLHNRDLLTVWCTTLVTHKDFWLDHAHLGSAPFGFVTHLKFWANHARFGLSPELGLAHSARLRARYAEYMHTLSGGQQMSRLCSELAYRVCCWGAVCSKAAKDQVQWPGLSA